MNTATAILFFTFLGSTLVLTFYYLYYFIRVSRYTSDKKAGSLPPVSIIIAAKNESVNLAKYIPLILEQDYPKFEVIVINDGSDLETDTVLQKIKETYENLEVTHIAEGQKTYSGKKLPLTLGIKKAKYNHLIFTDADCYPESSNWLMEMARNETPVFKIGYSPYERSKGLLNKLIRYDTTQIGVQYLSFALAGSPYMGVGRNMGYKKDFFFEVGGFRSQYHISSGDDDLFINKFATKDNYQVVMDKDSFTISSPKKKWKSWWKQKRRHLSTSSNYKRSTKLKLGIYHAFQILFYLSVTLLLVNKIRLEYVISILLAKTIIQLLISSSAFKKLNGSDLLALSPIYEPLLLLMNILVMVSLRFSKKIRWK